MKFPKIVQTIFVLFAIIFANKRVNCTKDEYLNYLPDCKNVEESNERNFFVVSTLDGKINFIDAVHGKLKWSKQIHSGPLLSSTLNDLIRNNKGEVIRVVPSLDGDLYLHNGRSIKKTPFSAEKLVKNSLKFSENVLLVGGHESKIIGLRLTDGEIIYKCGHKGCSQNNNITYEDIILFKKNSQSVRAINSLNGKEEWHFVVNDPQLLKISNQCHDKHEEKSKYLIDFKVLLPNGYITSSVYYSDDLATKSLYKSWIFKFDSPIVNMWHFYDNDFVHVNLFHPDNIDLKGLRLSDDLKDIHLYIGSFNNKLYIQKSMFYENDNSLTNFQDNMRIEDKSTQHNKAIIQIGWNNYTLNDSQNAAKNFEITETDIGFIELNNLNSFDYYFFKLNQSSEESNKCIRIESSQKSSTENISDNINEIVYMSIWYYWKEILAICITSWAVMSYIFSLCKKFGYNLMKTKLVVDESSNINNDITIPKQYDTIEKECQDVKNVESLYTSRYLQDFEQLNLIGKGGFGMVFEAKHKIDERHYAVKRISIPSNEEKRHKFMREIRALSNLDHVGIVRYYNAWIEAPPYGWQEQQDKLHNYDLTDTFNDTCNSSEFKINSYATSTKQSISTTNAELDWQMNQTSLDSLEIVFEESEDKSDRTNDQTEHEDSKMDDKYDSFLNNTNGLSMQMSTDFHKEVSSHPKLKPSPKVYVYIQMQLCKKETLKDWIFSNKVRDKNEISTIFTQLIDAVNYVHSNKLIHRDLKPSNIFFSMDGLVKIGDFGLVTNVVDEDSNTESFPKNKNHKYTNDVGTQLYMSPEQIKNEPYDHKVDIFSLGIILYELLTTFNTESERIYKLNDARNKSFPEEFIENHEKEFEVLQKLLSKNPTERPESSELLNYDIF